MDKTSLNITQDVLDQLKQILPQAFSEQAIDFDKLKTILSDYITPNERYNLSWAGKSNAYKILQTPISDTLKPNKEQSIEWDNAQNVFIEGENLAVLKILQKSYYGKVKMIYIDPPYNTGNDSFIYPDKFKESEEEYLQRVGDKDEDGKLTKSGMFRKNSKENGHYHSNWLNMMLPRLFLARNLLRDDGVIFISIDDNEQANLKLLCDEIFGEDNVESYIWNLSDFEESSFTKTASNTVRYEHEYIIACFKSNKKLGKYEEFRFKDREDFSNPDNDIRGAWMSGNISRNGIKSTTGSKYFEITTPTGFKYTRNWTITKDEFNKLKEDNRIFFSKNGDGVPRLKIFKNESSVSIQSSIFTGLKTSITGKNQLKELFNNILFDFPKPTTLITRLLEISTSNNDIILDFFAGSGTTAQAVMELNEQDGGNRKYICVQLDEQIDEKTEAFNAGYTKISDITQARIEKVIQKIQKERLDNPNTDTQKQNLGFRKYTLSTSNFKEWIEDIQYTSQLEQQMLLNEVAQIANSDIYHILWELMLKQGLGLDSQIQTINIDNSNFYYTNNIVFVLEKYNNNIHQAILKLKPQKVIALDSAFSDDNVKTNASLKFEDENIDFESI
ncbi:MAG: hypothetical protein RLZZ210_903 [Pseudomonadota bacterium]|jgi:adenine-specific DNA-methyltransferase